MTGRYKVTGIDPGDTDVRLGNCLTMRRSHDVVNTPGMYAKIRGSTMGGMISGGSIDKFKFFEELFASDIVLDNVVPEPAQFGDATESDVLVAALLIAFPDARFGIGLSGGEDSLGGGHYRSLGKQAVALLDPSEARDFLTRLFEYLRNNSYWKDDDLVHMLALLSALCQDRGSTAPVQVLSLSTSGKHQVDLPLVYAYLMVEALLEMCAGESVCDAVARWNDNYQFQLDADKIDFIRNLRDVSLHFRAERAEPRLRDSQIALDFNVDTARQSEFRSYGIQRLLREAVQAYVLARMCSTAGPEK